jgi:hypothetical protein
MHADDVAQSSIDFLTAIAIFMLTFAYLMIQIPSIFAPFQTQSTDLQPVAYRTGMILVEDAGWWDDSTANQNGTDWERESVLSEDICRIGLAANKHNPSNFSELMNRGKVCLLSEKKIKGLNLTYTNRTTHNWIRDRLGLNITRTYAYNISMQYLNGTTAEPMYVPNNTHPALCIGNLIPETTEVEKMERLVAIEGDSGVGYLILSATTNTSSVNLTLPKLSSFVVRVGAGDFREANRTADARLDVTLNNTDHNNISVIESLSGLYVAGWHAFNRTVIDDYLCDSNNITIETTFCNASYMWVNRSDWGDTVSDVSMPSAKLVVCIW